MLQCRLREETNVIDSLPRDPTRTKVSLLIPFWFMCLIVGSFDSHNMLGMEYTESCVNDFGLGKPWLARYDALQHKHALSQKASYR